MATLGEALRAKYRSPREAIRALGLDESLLKEIPMAVDNKALAKALNAISTRSVSVQALTNYLRPRLAKAHLAMDAAPLGIMPKIFEGVTGKTFKAQKPAIAKRVRELTKGKLAQDTSLDDVEKVLDMLDAHEIEGGDESVSEAQHRAMEAAAHGASKIGIPEKVGNEFAKADDAKKAFDADGFQNFLKEKGMGEDDIGTAMGMLPKHPATDEFPVETPEEKKKREEEEAAKDSEMKDEKDKPITKPAMDAALKATADTIRKTERGIRAALSDVRPWVGELPTSMALDSADDVWREAAKMLSIPDAATIHASALPTIVRMTKKAGAHEALRPTPAMGMDEAATDRLSKMFPGMANIRVG